MKIASVVTNTHDAALNTVGSPTLILYGTDDGFTSIFKNKKKS